MESMANSPTIVLLPVWGAGHFMPMLEAGKQLVASSGRAMSLTVLLMPSPTAQAASEISGHIRRLQQQEDQDDDGNGNGIRFHHLPEVKLPTDHSGIEEFISRIVQLHAPHLRAAMAGLRCPVAALVVDIFCAPALDVARDLAVPAYVYFTSSAALLALILRSPALREEEFHADGGLDLPGFPAPVPLCSLPDTMLERKKTTYSWFVDTGRRYMEANAIIVNTAAGLEPGVLAAIAAPAVYPIGPVLALTPTPPADAGPDACVKWLDSQPRASVLFLCFGSKGFLTTPQAIAHGLERSGHRFLWVLRGRPEDTSHGKRSPMDADLAELLPEGFLDKTKGRGLVWPKRAPQKEILAHGAVGGFVTHCGWNSVLESLWFGVPMLPWPLGADQHLNAFAMASGDMMGVAVPLKVDRERGNFVEAAELERAVRSLMAGAGQVRDKAMEMMKVCRDAVDQSQAGSSCASLRRLSKELLQGAVLLPKPNTHL
ncbi:anthocyanidin 3-O-glucosyltransferase 2 isoform X2 [Brachypodium distachyon]|uniref:anthocyanidin 3-O-glucosyltransferase 2 isoform X2 n=1 Tax=Brachypodium distachyon TaxID=15368 RepID=UPI00052FF415|nr:anthocyanidin 3-O-glucosyltransferase 2 isoform X2 [Brachypodium distachyon]|eukprot:XP_010230675.1 anthocyanidin 3-O-glucosyltransferase 2 isoform X2 [Brachypodium distachyon]